MLRSDGLLLALLVVRKHADARAGVHETLRGLGRSEAASAHAVGQALIRKKLLTPQEFLVLQSLLEGARQPCRCGRQLVLLPAGKAARRRCACGAQHAVAAVPGLLAPGPAGGAAPMGGPAGSARVTGRRGTGSGSRRTRRRGPSERALQQGAPEDSARGKRIGRYALLARIGDGGMGTIWKALEPGTGRTVALKLLRPDASEDVKVRFQREAEALARLDHPSVVRVHDVAADERGRRFFTMEFVEGRELRELLPTLAPATLLELIARVAEGLHHAHEHGIVHRDIKPHNIIVTADGQPKIADFGLSRDLERSSLTEVGDLVGTPLYMSPEQLRGDTSAIDRRTDVYALGVVLYEGLTGRLPIEAKSLFDLQQKIARAVPERPSKLRPELPRELDRVVLKALEKRAEDRYQDALAFARDLRPLLPPPPGSGSGESGLGVISGMGQVGGAVRRAQARALVAVAVGLGAVLACGALGLQYLRLRERRQAAARELEDRQEAARGLLASVERNLREAQEAGARGDTPAAAAAARVGLDAAEELRRQLARLGADAPAAVSSGATSVRQALVRVAADALSRQGPDERERAGQLYRELLALRPAQPDPELLGALGRLELLDEHLPAALRHLNAALARDPGRVDDYWRRAEVCRGLGRFDYALLDYQSALERQAGLREVAPAWIHAGRARTLLAQGKLEAAAEAVAEALRLDELDVEARVAECNLLLARDEPEEALARLATLITALPTDARVRRARASAWLSAGDPEQALVDLDAAIAGGSAPPSAWVARARLHAVLGEDNLATADLEGALRRATPEDPVRQLTRLVQARHLRARGRIPDALAALSEALPAKLERDEQLARELLPHLMERVELRLDRGEPADLSAAASDLVVLEAAAPGERRVTLAGLRLRLRRGEAALAQAELDGLGERERDPRLLTLQARVELARADPARAAQRDAALRAALGAQESLLQLDGGFALVPLDPLGEALLLLERARRGLALLARLPGRRGPALDPIREDLERAARLAPWLVWPRVGLCRALLLAEDAPRALQEAERGLADALPAPALLAVHAEALSSLGRQPEALAEWDAALRLEGARDPQAARELPRAVRWERVGWLVQRARAARQAGRSDEARRDLNDALAVWPDHLDALDERQALLWAAGEKEAAEADRRRLELLVRDFKGTAEAGLREAWRLGSAGDAPAAVAALDPALSLVVPERHPELAAELLYARALLRLRGPDLPAALADLAGMLEWSRDAFLPLYDENGPLALAGQLELPRALEQLSPRLVSPGCDPEFLGAFVTFLARELGIERRVGPGLRACERFLAHHPAHFPARLLRAALLAHSGHAPRALYLIRQAAREPGCPGYAHFLAARLLAAEHDVPRALQALEQALESGFAAWQRIESDPALAPAREARGFARVLALSRGAGLLAHGLRIEEQARAHREGRAEALLEASRAASAGLSHLQALLAQGDARAATLAARLHLLRARQSFRQRQQGEVARDVLAALEASPALLLEWGELEDGVRSASGLPAPLLVAIVPREGERLPRLLPPVAPALLQCLAGAPAPLPGLDAALKLLAQPPLQGTRQAALCEAVLLTQAGDPQGALRAARAVGEGAAASEPGWAGLSAWLEARALAVRGDPAALKAPLARALEAGLRGPIQRDPALARLASAPELEPLLRAAAEAAPASPWDLE